MYFETYFYQTLLRPGSTEYCIFNCFTEELFAKHPLDSDDRLCQLPIPVSFFYGDKDWMRRYGVDKILQRNPYKDEQSRFIEVEKSDHHLYFDNPQKFAELIIEDLSTLPELVNLDELEESKIIKLERNNIQSKGIKERALSYLYSYFYY